VRSWARFSGAAVFALFFFVGEAAGAILEALGRDKPPDHPEQDD